MNPGGVRGALTFASSPAGEGDGVVTFGEAFTVQPFGNILQTLTLTGAQIDLMLEQQFCGVNSPFATPTPGFFKVLLPSAGFAYTWDAPSPAQPAKPPARPTRRSVRSTRRAITLNGVPLDLGRHLPRDGQQLPGRRRRRVLRAPRGHRPRRRSGGPAGVRGLHRRGRASRHQPAAADPHHPRAN